MSMRPNRRLASQCWSVLSAARLSIGSADESPPYAVGKLVCRWVQLTKLAFKYLPGFWLQSIECKRTIREKVPRETPIGQMVEDVPRAILHPFFGTLPGASETHQIGWRRRPGPSLTRNAPSKKRLMDAVASGRR